jgi:hypothetical protein
MLRAGFLDAKITCLLGEGGSFSILRHGEWQGPENCPSIRVPDPSVLTRPAKVPRMTDAHSDRPSAVQAFTERMMWRLGLLGVIRAAI